MTLGIHEGGRREKSSEAEDHQINTNGLKRIKWTEAPGGDRQWLTLVNSSATITCYF